MNATEDATEIRHVIGGQGSLTLRNVAGRVRLVGVDGDEVVVRCAAGRGGEPRLNVERSDGGLLVEPQRERGGLLGLRFDLDDSLDFDVQVPRQARLDIKTVSADIDGQDLRGEQDYKTLSADIRLGRAAGRMSVVTVSGDVRVHEADELVLDGASTSGDFTVEAALLRHIGVRTVSGDVRVRARLEPGPRHAVETVSGDLSLESGGGVSVDGMRAMDIGRRVRKPTILGDGAARLAFRTMSGDHDVTLAATETASAPTTTEVPTTVAAEAQPPASMGAEDRLAVLRALERGEIDVDQAARRLGSADG